MKKTRKLRIVCAALAVFVTVAALLPGISGTDALAVSQSQIDALEEQRDALRAEREDEEFAGSFVEYDPGEPRQKNR